LSESIDIIIPDLGDFADVEVIEVLVASGDKVSREDGLITLETDKATMDVPAPHDGVIESIRVSAGSRVSAGDVIGRMSVVQKEAPRVAAKGKPSAAAVAVASRPAAPAAAPVKSSAPTVVPVARTLPPINEAGFSKAHASPSVRKLARELGVDLARLQGTGPKQRILHEDLKAFVKSVMTGGAVLPGGGLPKVPVVDYAKYGPVEAKPLTRIQKISGPRLQASWINLPHVTQHDVADITQLEARRQALKGPAKSRGISLTPLAFIMKASIAALKEFPRVNASLSEDGESLVYKNYYHLGFAADTENGLMVPVIRNADTMDVYELARNLGELSALARDGKLKADQLQGASFTISSLGGIGGTAFTPIVNAPEVAILGVSRSTMQPVWNGKEFEPRLMLPLSFSYDHRVIDGAYAVRFTTFLAQALFDVDALLGATP
jgi:pyruvate dehydrogenase E2 component (dihydrolipoamide acetyltransferase)